MVDNWIAQKVEGAGIGPGTSRATVFHHQSSSFDLFPNALTDCVIERMSRISQPLILFSILAIMGQITTDICSVEAEL